MIISLVFFLMNYTAYIYVDTAKSADLESVSGWESVELDAAKREARRLIEEWSKPIPK